MSEQIISDEQITKVKLFDELITKLDEHVKELNKNLKKSIDLRKKITTID